MIKGVGIDIVELERIERLVEKPSFIARILSDSEKERFRQLSGKRQVEFLAGRFAAKEAYAKARGTGIGRDLSFKDIEVLSNEKGKPFIEEKDGETIHISISHSRDYAVAQVIIEGV